MDRTPFWQSIRWKLPALIGVVLLLVVTSLTFLSYRSLESTLLAAAQSRLAGATKILGDALRPGVQTRLGAMNRLAARPDVTALVAGSDVPLERLRDVFQTVPVMPGVTLELRSADGSCRATRGRDSVVVAKAGCLDWGRSLPVGSAALPIVVVADTARIGVSTPIRAADADSAAAPIGWLVERRPFSTNAGVALIEGLIGSGSRLYFGNADGSVWTDLTRPVPAPFAGRPADGMLQYERDGEDQFAAARALEDTPYIVAVEFPRAAVIEPAHVFLQRTLMAAVILIALGIALGAMMSRRIVLPLEEATAAAESVAGGSLGNRVHVERPDEVGRFAIAFNTMADEVERSQHELEGRVERRTQQLKDTLRQLRGTQDELVRKEKLATLGQLASSVGHELRNPLGVMSNAVYFLKMVLKDVPPTVTEYLDILKHQIILSEKIVSDLLDFSRIKPPQTETVSVRDLVQAQLDRVGSTEGIEIVTAMPGDLAPVRIDRVQVGQVLFNLLTNAVQAMEQGGTLKVSASGEDGLVRLAVEDTGTGIAPDQLEKIFDPLFTTKARGIGLGLSVARSLARANRGDIAVTSVVGRGSTFVLTMPTHDGSAAA